MVVPTGRAPLLLLLPRSAEPCLYSVWARPLTVPCFLGTAQQDRKGYNAMYIATTAAEAAILANYISARQLYQLAKANLAPVQAAVHKQFRANSLAHNCNDLRDRLAAMDGGVTGLYRTMCNYGMQALALGLITWEEYKTATNQ